LRVSISTPFLSDWQHSNKESAAVPGIVRGRHGSKVLLNVVPQYLGVQTQDPNVEHHKVGELMDRQALIQFAGVPEKEVG
jgi:hypothetical protein